MNTNACIWDQKCLIWVFGLKFKKLWSYWKSVPSNENEFLTQTANFGIGSAFLKVQGPGPLYKVCIFFKMF